MTAAPERLMAGARNCIAGYAQVQPGEQVLVWTDGSPEVEADVVDALVAALTEAEARPAVLQAAAPIFRFGERPGGVVEEAIRGADVLIHLFPHGNAASIDNIFMLRYMFEYACRFVAVIATTRRLMESDWATYPMALYWELFSRAAEQVSGQPFHLFDEKGTDLRGGLKAWRLPGKEGSRPAGVTQSGSWTFFPSGNVPLHPESPLNGTMAWDSMEGFGVLDEPLLLEVRDHRVTTVEGSGPAGRWLRRMLDRYENADYVCELTWGIHPKASRSLGKASRSPDTILYRHPGVWHAGLGMWPGVGVPSIFHWDGGGMTSTLRIGETVVIDRGHLCLLDGPDLRSVAAEFGDPDDLLAVER